MYSYTPRGECRHTHPEGECSYTDTGGECSLTHPGEDCCLSLRGWIDVPKHVRMLVQFFCFNNFDPGPVESPNFDHLNVSQIVEMSPVFTGSVPTANDIKYERRQLPKGSEQ